MKRISLPPPPLFQDFHFDTDDELELEDNRCNYRLVDIYANSDFSRFMINDTYAKICL